MDICDFDELLNVFKQYEIDGVIHLCSRESCRSKYKKILFTFARTNVLGTLSLLQAAKVYWESLPEKYAEKRFYHISTDEVYGTLDFDGTLFTEQTKYDPHSPYSASKASSDHL